MKTRHHLLRLSAAAFVAFGLGGGISAEAGAADRIKQDAVENQQVDGTRARSERGARSAQSRVVTSAPRATGRAGAPPALPRSSERRVRAPGHTGRTERRVSEPKTPKQAPSASVYQRRVKASIRMRMSALQRCYEAAVRTRPNLAGKLSYTLTVGTDGAVKSIRAGKGSLRNTAVDRCSVARIKAWRFSMAGAPAPIQVSFSAVFTSS